MANRQKRPERLWVLAAEWSIKDNVMCVSYRALYVEEDGELASYWCYGEIRGDKQWRSRRLSSTDRMIIADIHDQATSGVTRTMI